MNRADATAARRPRPKAREGTAYDASNPGFPTNLPPWTEAGLRRRLSTREGGQAAKIVLDGQALVNFGSNDYLALAADPRLAAAAIAAIQCRRLWQRGQSADHRALRDASAAGTAAGGVRRHGGGAGVSFRLRRQPGRRHRLGRPRRRRLQRCQEPCQPLGRLPAFAGRCPRLPACRLAAARCASWPGRRATAAA